MAKVITTDPAEVERKLAVLRPRLEELELKVQQETDPKQKKKLIQKIEKTEDKIRQAKTGERFSRQTKRDFVAYSFIAPNFIGFAVLSYLPLCWLSCSGTGIVPSSSQGLTILPR